MIQHMSNTQNLHPTGSAHDIRAGRRLAALADEAAGDRGAAHARLVAEIDDLLAARQDGAFEAAYSMIGDEAARAALESSVEDASQTIELFVGWAGAAPRPSEAMLFAVPVILGILPGEEAPAAIPHLERLVEGLRRHRLIGADPAVHLAPELLRLADVEMPPSRRRRHLQGLITRYFGGDAGTPSGGRGTDEADVSVLESGFPQLSLRFLAGAVISTLEAEERPFYPTVEEADAYDDRCHAWSDEASAWLEEATGHAFALALPPEILSDAIKTGIDEYRAAALEITVKTAALASPGGAAQCRAVVEPVDDRESPAGIRIAVHGGGAVSEYTWPAWSFDEPPATLDWILEILGGEGVGSIETAL